YYLKYAAVSPVRQGKGLGGAMIREGLARARAAGVDTILETATPSNVGLYQSLGFETVEEWDVPKAGGPHFWNMAAD
ncbi:MAG: GNAT family N-acetyltransferase, partial [Pontixanthobacter sp.]